MRVRICIQLCATLPPSPSRMPLTLGLFRTGSSGTCRASGRARTPRTAQDENNPLNPAANLLAGRTDFDTALVSPKVLPLMWDIAGGQERMCGAECTCEANGGDVVVSGAEGSSVSVRPRS